MLNRLDTVLTQIRHRCRSLIEGREWTRKTAIIAAAGAIVLAGSTAVTFLGGETDPSQQQAALSISETPDVKAVTAKARARVAGGRLSAPVITLPAVTRSMSDDTFYAVVENAIDIAGEDRLAKRFSKLSEEQIARERQCLARNFKHHPFIGWVLLLLLGVGGCRHVALRLVTGLISRKMAEFAGRFNAPWQYSRVRSVKEVTDGNKRVSRPAPNPR